VELRQRLERGEKLVILDTRTPEEYRRFCIPGGRSVPGGELALRITDIAKDLDKDTTIVVNCAGRTRSIIGTRVLQRMGLKNVCGLKNGTAGWMLAGYELESGADRIGLTEVSPEGRAAAEAYAARLAQEDGVCYLDILALREVMATRERETVYLIDVRTREEYEQGHIPGFRWFPGGQAVQRSDDVAVVHNAAIVFACDGKARATVAASWYRQMGFQEVYAVEGGVAAWAEAGLGLEKGIAEPEPFGLAEARKKVQLVSPQTLQSNPPPVAIFVDTSQDFIRGHVPGSRWVPRGWLEFQIGELAPSREVPVSVTGADGRNSTLAGAALRDLGYQSVSVLEGGMAAWRQAGLPVEEGLSGVMRPPNDLVFSGPDRTYADMMNYLRWEETLGHKYESP
jgi:rhodanese-related sulfurtransferase